MTMSTSAVWVYQHTDSVGKYRPTTMITKADDIDRQIENMAAQGYVIYSITLEDYCVECKGSGRVPKRNTKNFFASKACPICKGHVGPLVSRAFEVAQ